MNSSNDSVIIFAHHNCYLVSSTISFSEIMGNNTRIKGIYNMNSLINNITNFPWRYRDFIKTINNIEGVPFHPNFFHIHFLSINETMKSKEGSTVWFFWFLIGIAIIPILSPLEFLITIPNLALPGFPFEAPSNFILNQFSGVQSHHACSLGLGL